MNRRTIYIPSKTKAEPCFEAFTAPKRSRGAARGVTKGLDLLGAIPIEYYSWMGLN